MSNFVKSTIKINFPKIKQLSKATTTALEETIEALKTEVINAQVMPFDTGNMQNNSTFTDISKSKIKQGSQNQWKSKRPESHSKIFQLYLQIIFQQMKHVISPFNLSAVYL